MNDPLIDLAIPSTPHIIKVIGVGGGGGNAVAQMYHDNIPEVRYLVTNTDTKALETNVVPDQLRLGPGLGAGGDPKKGKAYAEESVENIREALDKDTHMVFITAGMGGGTGTGASPIIAREAQKKGILTVGIVTIPFLFERERQINKALDGLDMLAQEVDALLVINNQRLIDIYGDMSIIQAFKQADKTLSTAVRSITEIISMHGRVNLDFEDVKTVLTKGGVAVMSTGFAEGERRVTRAIAEALNSPLLNNNDVYRANRILLAVTMGTNPEYELTMNEMNEISEFMERFPTDIHTKWGLKQDETLGAKIKITILAAGFGLYSDRKNDNPLPQFEETPEQQERRNRFYTNQARPLRSKPRCYLFTEADLENTELLNLVEQTPTWRRTNEQLKAIQQCAGTALPHPEPAPEAGETISFS